MTLVFEELKHLASQAECWELQRFPGLREKMLEARFARRAAENGRVGGKGENGSRFLFKGKKGQIAGFLFFLFFFALFVEEYLREGRIQGAFVWLVPVLEVAPLLETGRVGLFLFVLGERVVERDSCGELEGKTSFWKKNYPPTNMG